MLIVAVMGFIFNLIQMKILHSGEGHYDPGEEVQQAHGHNHGHSHSHDHDKKKIKDSEVKKTLLQNEEGHQAEHVHGHGNHEHHHHAAVKESNPRDASMFAVICNLLLSLSLIGVATSIYFFPWMQMGDLIYVCVFALVIICTTMPVASEVMTVMMEGTPSTINVEQLRHDMEAECGNDITDIHDLHVWTVSVGNVAMTCHI